MSEETADYLPREPLRKGVLEVGISADGREVVINHPDLEPDEHGCGHIVLSPEQAWNLARSLAAKAMECSPAMVGMPASLRTPSP